MLKTILPEDLICLNDYEGRYPLQIDLVYAKASHKDNMFKEPIYRPDAKMWIHKELLPIVLKASEICFKNYKYLLSAKDCLRTTEAQLRITETEIVKAHPHWTADGPYRLFSGTGKGGHPRAMAIDVILVNEHGEEVDMGTPFDYLTEDPNPENNPAARNYKKFPEHILQNRLLLENTMVDAAKSLNTTIRPLPVEWWDFRFTNEYFEQFLPLSDNDLPTEMQMVMTKKIK